MAIVNGILLLDKPTGLSSNAALQRARHFLDASKAGHSGTLDPMATGLLPLGFGHGTKALSYLLDGHKRYLATLKLGCTTTTGDAEGESLVQCTIPILSESLIQSALAPLRGNIQQIPPMYSALKHEGRPLYKLAREGITIERTARDVTIFHCDLLSYTHDEIQLHVWCSKGTYIRTLAESIGEALGCGAHLVALRRLGVAGFDPLIDVDMPTRVWCPFDAVMSGNIKDYLLPIDVALRHLPSLTLSDAILARLSQGQKIAMHDLESPMPESNQVFRLYDAQGQFYALGKPTPFQGLMLERWMKD
jgi:tRNA pseudouridine55 synthase